MQRALRPSALIPRGFDVESAIYDGDTTVITVSVFGGAFLLELVGPPARFVAPSLSVLAEHMVRILGLRPTEYDR